MSYSASCKNGFFIAKDNESKKKIAEILWDEADIDVFFGTGLEIESCFGYDGSYHEDDFTPIAELVTEGYLDFIGEDNSVWSLVFKDGKVEDVPGIIEWRGGKLCTN